MKRTLLKIAWLVVGLALLGWVIARAGPRNILDAFIALLGRPGCLAGALGLMVLARAAFLAKWHVMSRRAGADVTFRQSLYLFGTLALVGTFTPGRAGELVVPLLMRGGGRLTGVALVNRILESSWTLAVGVLAALFLLDRNSVVARLWGVGLGLAVLAGVMVVMSRRRHMEALHGLVRACLRPLARLRPVGWLLAQEQRYADGLGLVYEASERLLRPVSFLLFSGLMLAIWFMVCGSSYFLIQATVPPGGKEITFMLVVVAVATSAVAIYVSPIPGGLGLSELTVVALFIQLGYSGEVFVPYLLLARVFDHLIVIVLYLVARAAGRELPAPAAPGVFS